MLEERECKICGVWFQPKRKNNIYCEECSKRSGAKKKKMKRQIMISISRCGTGNKQGEHNNMPRFQSENARKPSCHSGKERLIEPTYCCVCGKKMPDADDRRIHSPKWYCSAECKEKEKWKIAREKGTVKTCPNCGKEHIQRGIYCSRECYKEHITKNPTHNVVKPLMTEKKCCVCHRLFSCQAAQAGDFFYCSKECYEKDMERNPSEYSYIVIPQKQAVISSEESAKKEEVKKRMKIAAADRGIVLEDFIVGHYFISGFFRKNEKWAYFSFDECRNSPLDFTAKDCWKGFLLRTAKNSKDYTGGTNHYTNLKGFMPLLEQLLG